MLKTSLHFLVLGFFLLLFADLEVTVLDPWIELPRIFSGLVTPDLLSLWSMWVALLNTLIFALCGIALAIAMGIPLAFAFSLAPVRMGCAVVRAVHEIFWAFIFLPIVGLNPVCGVFAIAVPYAGIFAKVFAEIRQESDQRPLRALPIGADWFSRFCYGVFPIVTRSLRNYTAYRFECALRSSAVLGFIGLPTLGFQLETAFREGNYSEAAAILYLFYMLILSLKVWLKPKLVPIWLAGAFVLLAKDVSFRWENVTRFGREILPWPMRREGFAAGTDALKLAPAETYAWLQSLFQNQGIHGLWNTLVLTQIALAVTGLVAVFTFPVVCRHFSGRPTRSLGNLLLVVLRTTPEYIIAYILIQLWGPSMLPAILAISVHNGAIMAHLTGGQANQLDLRLDAPSRRSDRFGFEVLPRVYGQLLAFLFYRWEVIARESAILGILGVYTLGFYIDSAVSTDKLDQAMALIGLSVLLNVGIDAVSQAVRRWLRLSVGKLVTLRE